ncbi:MAG TPA: methylmalonyl-CoA mutase family protein [Limnochordales bacterium]|nr:methylmalonyl-CoA mutase family protein [Limnochordales bacterium]
MSRTEERLAQHKPLPGQERKERFLTTSGMPIKGLYGPEDTAELDYQRDLGDPGEYPFTRGIHRTMYRGRLWTMRQFAGFGTAEETNARFRYLLQEGQTGLSVAFDLPTLMGYDSDHPRAEGEVGVEGVAVSSLADMETLFDGIPLDQVTTSMTINAPAIIIFAMYLAVAEKQGVPFDKLSGTLQADILKEYMAQNEWIFPPQPSMRLITDIFAYCAEHVPRWNTISISGYHIREAGATALQELAFTLANGREYVRAGIAAGLDVDAFAPRLSFFFNSHNDLFEEVAKFRAARRIWAKIMREEFGARNPRSWMLRFHTQTAGCSLTAQQPYNNVIRTTIQALAAVLGGTQSLHTNSLDEALSLPTEEAVRLALRTQQIIAHESGVANTPDPLGGSYFVEALTNQMEEGVWDYFRRIDELGGVIPAIEKGFFQREIADAAYEYQRRVESGEQIIVGVNAYTIDEETPIPILKIGPEIEAKQRERLARVRRERDAGRVRAALARVREAAASTENLVPPILEAVRAYATLGEIVDELRAVFGEYDEIQIL